MAASKKDVAKQQVKEDREKVREMYLSGKTVKEIAKETYFSSSYCYAMVRDLAKEKNLAKKAKRAPLNEAIDEGKFGEDLARKFLNDPIIKVNHGISHYDDVTQDKSYQDKDTDFIVWKKNGKTFGLEAKVDSHNTGNFYLETSVDYFFMVPDALNEQRVARRYRDGIDPLWHTPGWVYRSGADQILYYFRTTQLLYIFSRVDVWFYAEKLMRGGIHLDPGIRKPKMYSAENISERNGSTLFFANGLCVNAEQTYKALGAQKRVIKYQVENPDSDVPTFSFCPFKL